MGTQRERECKESMCACEREREPDRQRTHTSTDTDPDPDTQTQTQTQTQTHRPMTSSPSTLPSFCMTASTLARCRRLLMSYTACPYPLSVLDFAY
eukprot:2433620-Rhodomonas_salina.2